MRFPKTAWSIGLYALLWLAGVPALWAADELTLRKLRSAHFELYTSASERQGRLTLEHLERVRRAFEYLTDHKVNRPRARVVLFQGYGQFHKYGGKQGSGGSFFNARGIDFIVLPEFASNTRHALNHEYFHLFSHNARFNFPVWLEEGLAGFYSTIDIRDKELHLGKLDTYSAGYLLTWNGQPLPAANIFAIERSHLFQKDDRITSQLYAQGWALTHMTFLGADLRAKSSQFFREMQGHGLAADVYRSVYGKTAADLDALLDAYIRQASYPYIKFQVAGLNAPVEIESVSMDEWEGQLLLADLRTFGEKRELAAKIYEELSVRYPDVPEIDESIAYMALYTKDSDKEKAKRHLAAAIKKGSRTSSAYTDLLLASCDVRVMSEECQQLVNQALRFDSGNMLARKWAVANALNTKRFKHALVYLVRAGEVRGDEAPSYFEHFAYAQAMLGNREDAKAAIKRGMQYVRTAEQTERLEQMEKRIDHPDDMSDLDFQLDPVDFPPISHQ